MLQWNDILKFATHGSPAPDRRVEKTEEEWRNQLSPDQYRVTRQQGTERPFSSTMCTAHDPGRYACVCCDAPLFDSSEKFDSGTGWPSFTEPVQDNVIAYHADSSHGMTRIEVTCAVCDAHLGHVFPDGPEPTGLRFCINALSLEKLPEASPSPPEGGNALATFGGGCFWCTEAVFQQLRGVHEVKSGYSGGDGAHPTYREVCSGQTGHAEVIQLSYDPNIIRYEDLLRVHLGTHDPTTLNRQGADRGTQYRSIILVRSDEEREIADSVIRELGDTLSEPIVTEVTEFDIFHEAEPEHQNFYRANPYQGYCQAVIHPKMESFRASYSHLLKSDD